jgi:hypothetical protein
MTLRIQILLISLVFRSVANLLFLSKLHLALPDLAMDVLQLLHVKLNGIYKWPEEPTKTCSARLPLARWLLLQLKNL